MYSDRILYYLKCIQELRKDTLYLKCIRNVSAMCIQVYFKIRCIRIVSACICTAFFCIFVSNVQIHEIRTYLCAYLDTRSRNAGYAPGYGLDTV